MSEKDIFVNNKLYPNPFEIFKPSIQSISEIKEDCLFVLDTNALLLPYTIGSKSIEELKKVYGKLIADRRLFIPSQVTREFAKNRPEKLKEVFQQLNKKRNSSIFYKGEYPLLRGIDKYIKTIEQEKAIDILLTDYKKTLDEVISEVKGWTWNDPISQVYGDLFPKESIFDFTFNESEVRKDLIRRIENKIPPGYKDQSKDDDGVGDLIIWLSILALAKEYKKDVIFVSGEEKSDWFHKSDGQILYPRFELIAEFRENGFKGSFQIIKLSQFLEMFDADINVVEEIKVEEIKAEISETDQKYLLRKRVLNLKKLINKAEFAPTSRQWIYDNRCLVHDFNIQQMSIYVDVYCNIHNYEILICGRDDTSIHYLHNTMAKTPNFLPKDHSLYPILGASLVYERFNSEDDIELVANSLRDILHRIEVYKQGT